MYPSIEHSFLLLFPCPWPGGYNTRIRCVLGACTRPHCSMVQARRPQPALLSRAAPVLRSFPRPAAPCCARGALLPGSCCAVLRPCALSRIPLRRAGPVLRSFTRPAAPCCARAARLLWRGAPLHSAGRGPGAHNAAAGRRGAAAAWPAGGHGGRPRPQRARAGRRGLGCGRALPGLRGAAGGVAGGEAGVGGLQGAGRRAWRTWSPPASR